MLDLFGNTVTESFFLHVPKKKTLINKALGDYRYRKSTSEKKCSNCVRGRRCHGYFKCALVGISASAATDIRLNNVCDAWEPKEKQGE